MHVDVVLVLDEAEDGGNMAAVGSGVQRRELIAVLRVHLGLQLPHQQLYQLLPALHARSDISPRWKRKMVCSVVVFLVACARLPHQQLD